MFEKGLDINRKRLQKYIRRQIAPELVFQTEKIPVGGMRISVLFSLCATWCVN
jgi:hypothetical protein